MPNSPDRKYGAISRRSFLKVVGTTVAGAGIAAALGDSGTKDAQAAPKPPYSPGPEFRPILPSAQRLPVVIEEIAKSEFVPSKQGTPVPLEDSRLFSLTTIPTEEGPFEIKGDVICSVHTVKNGDTFREIAEVNHTSVEALVRANKTINDPNRIEIGWNLAVPCDRSSKEFKEKLIRNNGVLIFTNIDTREVVSIPVGRMVPITIYVEKWGTPYKALVTLMVNDEGEIKDYSFPTKDNGRLSIKFKPSHSGYFMILPSVDGVNADRAIVIAGR